VKRMYPVQQRSAKNEKWSPGQALLLTAVAIFASQGGSSHRMRPVAPDLEVLEQVAHPRSKEGANNDGVARFRVTPKGRGGLE